MGFGLTPCTSLRRCSKETHGSRGKDSQGNDGGGSIPQNEGGWGGGGEGVEKGSVNFKTDLV